MFFEDGKKISDAYVEIDGKRYPVIMPEYEGKTPISAFNLNKLQNELKELIGVSKNVIEDCDGLYSFGFYKIAPNCVNCPSEVNPSATQLDGNMCFLFSLHDDSGAYEPWIQFFIDPKEWGIYMRSTEGEFTGKYKPWTKISADAVIIM